MLIKYLPAYDRAAWGNVAYAKLGDAGFDLRAAIGDPVTIYAGQTRLIPAGIQLAVPFGYELQIRPRSGLAFKNSVTVLNSPGTIDSGYRGEIGVILINHHDHKSFTVLPGDRIAQGVLAAVAYEAFDEVDELPSSERGATGFGSSGVSV
jgi:dUTP pyrophosphatase